MSSSLLECVASGALDVDAALRWLSTEIEDELALPEQLRARLGGITRYQFAAEFLHALRLHTEPLVVPPASITPRKPSSAANIHHDSSPMPVSAERRRRRPHAGPASAGSGGARGTHSTPPPTRQTNVTPRGNCLGDFIVTMKHTHSGKKRGNKNTSTDSIESTQMSAGNTSTPNNVTSTSNKHVTPDTSSELENSGNNETSDKIQETPLSMKSFESRLFSNTSDIGFQSPEASKSRQIPSNSNSRKSAETILQTPEPNKNKNNIRRVNLTSINSNESTPSVFNFKGVAEIDPSDRNQFKYNQNKHSTPTNTVLYNNKCKSTPEDVKKYVFSEIITPFSVRNANKDKVSENETVKDTLNTSKNKSNEITSVCETPNTSKNILSELSVISTPVTNISTVCHAPWSVSDRGTPMRTSNDCHTPWSLDATPVGPPSECHTPWSAVTNRGTPMGLGTSRDCHTPWSREDTPVTDTPIRVTPLTDSMGFSECSGISVGSAVSRVGMRPRALAAAFDQPKDAQTQANDPSRSPTPPVGVMDASPPPPAAAPHQAELEEPCEVSNARAIEACGRLYAAILDHNLVDIVPNEIAYLGSLLSCRSAPAPSAPVPRNALIRSPHDATYLARTVLRHTALHAMVTSQPRVGRDTEQAVSVAQYDAERDGMTAFNHPHSFSAHKRQRDAFNHLYRWWRERDAAGCSEPATAETSVRARARAIVGAGRGEVNAQHLAALVVTHLVHDTNNTMQESKLSKLRRRLTAPSTASPALPHEEFYREVFTCSESATWHHHVSAALANALANTLDVDKRISTEELSRRVRLASCIGRLMGSLAGGSAGGWSDNKPPSHQVLENAVTARHYSQPCVDLRALVVVAGRGRLVVGLPFVHHYLAQCDYTTVRQPYYTRLLKGLLRLYRELPRVGVASTRTYLTWIVSSTFASPTYPPHLLPSRADDLEGDSTDWIFPLDMSGTVDGAGTLDSSVLHECIPSAKGILGAPASSASVTAATRHVTPVTLPPDPMHAIKQKQKQLQSRLEQQLLQTSGSGARRALDMCVERATAHGVTCLTRNATHAVSQARDATRQAARDGQPQMSLQAVFRGALSDALAQCVVDCTSTVKQHAVKAVSALLVHHGAVGALAAVAGRRADHALAQWARDRYTPEVVCPDMAREVAVALSTPHPSPSKDHSVTGEREMQHADGEVYSVAEALISLKECVCLVVEDESGDVTPASALKMCARVCQTTVSPADESTSTRAWQRAMLQLTLDLCTALVCRRPEVITTSFLQSMESIWTPLSPPSSEPTYERQAFTHDCESTNGKRASRPRQFESTNERQLQTPASVASTNEKAVSLSRDLEPTNQRTDVSPPPRESIDPANEELAPTPPTSDDEDDYNRVKNIVIDTAFVQKHVIQQKLQSLCECACVAASASATEGDACVWGRVVCVRNVALLATAPPHLHAQVWSAWRTLVAYVRSSGRLPSPSLSNACLSLTHADHRPHVLNAVKWALRAVRGVPPLGQDNDVVDILHQVLNK